MRAACGEGGSGLFDGFQADVFSLGVVLYSLLVGSYPWRDTHESDPVYLRFSRTGHLPGLRDPLAYDLVHRPPCPSPSPEPGPALALALSMALP